MIVIIDNKMGNIRSVTNALTVLGAEYIVSQNPVDISKADGLILPGVGNFKKAMINLNQAGFTREIIDYAKQGKPILGICLGMQLLFDSSDEGEKEHGLSLIEGNVLYLNKTVTSLAIPHIGWNDLSVKESKLLDGVSNGDCVYFVHSYAVSTSAKNIIATTDYSVDIVAAVEKNNIYGVQFHPEKSQRVGLKILENFIRLC
jgi:glutamine amidotransferase